MTDSLFQDLRYGARTLRRSPVFAAVVILTLALGVGANTAIFSVVNAVLLRPLPYQDSDRFVRLYENLPAPPTPGARPRRLPGIAVRELLELRARSRRLSHVVSHGVAMVTAACGAEAVRLFGAPLSAAALPMLGVQPARGRWYSESEEASGAARLVLLSDATWQRCFQRDPAVIGKTLTFTGRAPGGLGGDLALNTPFTIVGVMPRAFRFPDEWAQFWTPMPLAAPADGRPRRTSMMARVADGVSIDAAVAELRAIVQEVRGEQTPFDSRRFELIPVHEETAARVRPALLVMAAAVGFVLLIACANVANLLLARTTARRREMAIRVAVGAGRLRLIRQMLTEAMLLATIGGVAGTALAFAGVRLFRALGTNLPRFDLRTGAAFPRLDEIVVDPSVLLFAVAASMVTGLMFGLAPALRVAVMRDVGDLRGRGHRAQGALVVVQIAMATLLFVGSALLGRSFVSLIRVDPGYDPSHVLTFQIATPGERGTVAQMRTFAEDIVSRLQVMHGVQGAGYANQLPMVNLRDTSGGLFRMPDSTRPPPPVGPDARFISRGYLAAMGMRVIAGRGFGDADGPGQPRVLLINQTLAASDFAGENPIGQNVYIGRRPDPWEIIGIVADVRQFGLDRVAEPQFFVDVRQMPEGGTPLFPAGAYYVVRTTADVAMTLAAVRGIVRDVEPRAGLDNIAPMERIVSNSMSEPRLYATLLGVFATVAVALAAIGIYGVVTYSVSQRTREIGIRMALGAARRDVLGMIVRQGVALTAVGIAIGLAAAAGTSRYLESMLFGVTALDPSTFVVVAVAFAAVSTLASYVPARRAAQVSPMIALRAE